MKRQDWHLTFLTPAFLGNAEQTAQWRTPPFKALLRQWWRVAWAAEHDSSDFQRMRHEEGRLFGHAWLDNDKDDEGKKVAARKSRVRLRLSHWHEGSLKKGAWSELEKIKHEEVKNKKTGLPVKVDAGLYLGYGPLEFDKKAALKHNAAIQAGESATLSIAYPENAAALIEEALRLMHHFGTLGGRSRNGWGSLHMEHENGGAIAAPDDRVFKRWGDALQQDWPHAIGKDEHDAPLIWHTQSFADWRGVMQELARIKIALRTHFTFHSGKNAPAPEQRHWLSYPVTNHFIDEKVWDKGARLPNSLRFKVCRSADGKLFGKIFHIPCLPPPAFQPDKYTETIKKVWTGVHQFLDGELGRLKN